MCEVIEENLLPQRKLAVGFDLNMHRRHGETLGP